MLLNFLSQFPYLSLKTSHLGGQGSNLSLVRLRRLGGALGKAGPPCKAFCISSHLPKKKKKKASRTGEQSANGQGTFLRKLRATTEINAKIEKPSYHRTWDGNKALIKPFLSSHVGITPDPRSDTALAYARLVKGWGGGGGGGGGTDGV